MDKAEVKKRVEAILPAAQTFLDRVQLQGNEAATLVHVKQTLQALPALIDTIEEKEE